MSSRYVKHKQMDDDVTHSIYIGGQSEPYSSFIRSFQIHPAMIIHYFSDTQLEWYGVHSTFEYTCLSIDATGGIIRSIRPPNGKYIFFTIFII